MGFDLAGTGVSGSAVSEDLGMNSSAAILRVDLPPNSPPLLLSTADPSCVTMLASSVGALDVRVNGTYLLVIRFDVGTSMFWGYDVSGA